MSLAPFMSSSYPISRLLEPSFFGTMPSLNTELFRQMAPRYEVSDGDKEITISVGMPGISKENINVHFDDSTRMLEVKGEQSKEQKTKSSQTSEFRSFYKSWTLPEEIDGKNLVAQYEDGLLRLKAPKLASLPIKEARHKIAIQ